MISTAAVTELHQLHIGKDGVLTIGGAHSSVGGVVVVVVVVVVSKTSCWLVQ